MKSGPLALDEADHCPCRIEFSKLLDPGSHGLAGPLTSRQVHSALARDARDLSCSIPDILLRSGSKLLCLRSPGADQTKFKLIDRDAGATWLPLAVGNYDGRPSATFKLQRRTGRASSGLLYRTGPHLVVNIVSLELNELNFDFVAKYCEGGELPNFSRLLRDYRLFQTISEKNYPQLEPWIQWPTDYTGKTFGQHGIFRLGDIVEADHDQIWELLEEQGVTVGAISPMNAANRCRNPDFFIPDPWTVTNVSGDDSLHRLYAIVRDTVNANAHEDRSPAAIGRALLPLFLRYASLSSAKEYLRILHHARRYNWSRAIFLDRFLADLFLKLRARKKTGFSSLFLNAGAHIQHHYMYDSAAYDGEARNPSWYSDHRQMGLDPLLQVYRAYDAILGEMMALKETRLLVTTGLSQYPNPNLIHQYRFKDHAAALDRLGIVGGNVVPRMSRDFLVEFSTPSDAVEAERRMAGISCEAKPLFSVENRGASLFCQIVYFGPLEGLRKVEGFGGEWDISEEVALVSIENGLHQTVGYHVDTAVPADDDTLPPTFPLAEIFSKIRSAFVPVPA